MPRQPRIEYEGAIYHVMSRGYRQEAIVEEDEDSGKRSYGDMDPRFQLPPSLATVGKLCQRQGLTPELYRPERSRLENLAIKNSDAEAAYDLATYYYLSAFNTKQAYRWFKIAKKLGSKRAVQSVADLKRFEPLD